MYVLSVGGVNEDYTGGKIVFKIDRRGLREQRIMIAENMLDVLFAFLVVCGTCYRERCVMDVR